MTCYKNFIKTKTEKRKYKTPSKVRKAKPADPQLKKIPQNIYVKNKNRQKPIKSPAKKTHTAGPTGIEVAAAGMGAAPPGTTGMPVGVEAYVGTPACAGTVAYPCCELVDG